MSYSSIYIGRSSKVPVPLTIFVLIAILVFLARFLSSNPPASKATDKKIEKLKILNLTHSSATVVWQSQKKETGYVFYSNDPAKIDRVALDERDIPEKKQPFMNHYVSIGGLTGGTTYFYKIISDNELVTRDKNKPFSFKTPQPAQTISQTRPAYG